MQVVFFEGNNPASLQDRINTWLKEQGRIMIHLIVQSVAENKHGKAGDILISLWYTDLTGVPSHPGQGLHSGIFGPGDRLSGMS